MKTQLHFHNSVLLWNSTGEGFPERPQVTTDLMGEMHWVNCQCDICKRMEQYSFALDRALSTSIPCENQSLIPNPVEGMTYEVEGQIEKVQQWRRQALGTWTNWIDRVDGEKGVQNEEWRTVARLLPEKPETCPKCKTPLMCAIGIGPYCPNEDCDVIDNIDSYSEGSDYGRSIPDGNGGSINENGASEVIIGGIDSDGEGNTKAWSQVVNEGYKNDATHGEDVPAAPLVDQKEPDSITSQQYRFRTTTSKEQWEPLVFVNAYPDEDYPRRILEAHLQNCEGYWASESPVAKVMNEAQQQRKVILQNALNKFMLVDHNQQGKEHVAVDKESQEELWVEIREHWRESNLSPMVLMTYIKRNFNITRKPKE